MELLTQGIEGMHSRTSIVIPNYNGINYLADCLEAIRGQTLQPERVIVIDNGSSDGSADYLKEHYPWLRLVLFDHNTGFCGAVNEGIRISRAESMDYCILLNNDTKADADFIKELVRAMDEDDRIFSCQAKMLCMSDPSRMDDAGDLYCSLGWAFARGKGKPEEKYNRRADIFSSCAGAAIYRMSVFDEIGIFDENHFAYLEDADIGWRARICGYRNVFVPTAKVLHVGSASSGSIYNLFKVKNTSRNSIYLISKNMPLPQIIINLPLLIAGFSVKAVFFAVKGFGKEYLNGLIQGVALSETGKKEGRKFRRGSQAFPQYVRIQLELWINTIRRFI